MKNNNNEVNTGFYNFTNKDLFGQSLIHLINLYLPKDSVVVEVGALEAQTSCMIAQHCPNIKKIYAIDQYLPYKNTYGPAPVGKKEIDFAKMVAKHNIDFSGFKEKIDLIESDCISSLNMFEDDSIDLIFYDINVDYNTALNHISQWYKKLKPNGIFSGHCWDVLQKPILDFKKGIKNENTLSIYDNVWTWIK
jgi:hypothetical protein